MSRPSQAWNELEIKDSDSLELIRSQNFQEKQVWKWSLRSTRKGEETLDKNSSFSSALGLRTINQSRILLGFVDRQPQDEDRFCKLHRRDRHRNYKWRPSRGWKRLRIRMSNRAAAFNELTEKRNSLTFQPWKRQHLRIWCTTPGAEQKENLSCHSFIIDTKLGGRLDRHLLLSQRLPLVNLGLWKQSLQPANGLFLPWYDPIRLPYSRVDK